MNFSAGFWRVIEAIGGLTISKQFHWTGYRKPEVKKMAFRYFQDSEVEGLDVDFVNRLDRARHIAGIPFVITSGYRSPERNQSIIGAVADSAHIKGLAVDMRVENSHEVFVMVHSLVVAGINRIGIYVNKDWQPIHIHADADPEKIPEVLFIRQEGAKS